MTQDPSPHLDAEGSGSPELGHDGPDERNEKLAAITSDLARLGAETETERAVKRIVPWVASLAVHGALVLLGFLLTWTVVMLQPDDDPVRIIADFDSLTYEPLARLDHAERIDPEETIPDRRPTEVVEDRLDESLDVELDPLDFIATAASPTVARFAPDPTLSTASFVGLSSTNARRIVYVIDASGSMIRSLPIVIEELARSLDGLVGQQEFTVIFFQRNEALIVPPVDRLSPGTDDEKARVLAWIDQHVIPAGRSNPLSAIELALGFDPDVIFMLSENITGSGEFEIDQSDLLALLEDLNPLDSSGRRPTQINCVQFLDPDPLRTLEKIARRHGGERGYKFLDRAELGLRAP